MKYIIRILVSPFIFGLLFVSAMVFIIKNFKLFILYGGEWTSYQKNDITTIHEIYLKLKENAKV